MQKLVWQNANGDSIDLTSGNYGITQWEGFSNTSLNIQSQQVPFQDGAVFLDALIDPRELSVTLKMQDNGNLEERYRMRRELIHILNPKLGEGYLIYTNDFISKRIKCVAQVPLFETHNSDTRGTPSASLAWTACEPYWEDLEDTVVLFKDGDIIDIENNGDIDIGVEISGSFSNESVNIKNEINNKLLELQGQDAGQYLISTTTGHKEIVEIQKGLNYILTYYTSFTMDIDDNILITTNSGVLIKINGFTHISYIQGPKNADYISYANGIYFIGTNGYLYKSVDLENFDTIISGTYMSRVIYGKGKYIAITTSQRLYTSTDAINWTMQNVEMYIHNIIYSPEKDIFVLVGSDGTIKTSPDAITWTTRTSGVSVVLLDITYSRKLGKFICVGGSGVILTSSDAIIWTQQTSGIEGYINSVACNDDLIIASSQNGLLKSADGISWSLQSVYMSQIIYNDYFVGFTNTGEIKYSKTGDYFTTLFNQKGDVYRSNIRDLKKYGNKIFAYGQYLQDIRIYETEDNWKTWTLYTINSYNEMKIKYVYDGQKFVYIAGNIVSSSSDFENWDTYDFNERVDSISYCKEQGQFVVSSTSHIWKSSNAITWTSYNVTGMYYITYSEYYHKYYAISQTEIYESDDAITWNAIKDFSGYIYYSRIEENDGVIGVIANKKFIYKRPNENWKEQNYSIQTDNVSFCVINNVIYFLLGSDKIYEIDSREVLIDSYITIYNYALSLLNNNGDLYVSGFTYIGNENKDSKTLNQIDKLTMNSDIGFNLKAGNNRIIFSNKNGAMSIKFRQKYIGV